VHQGVHPGLSTAREKGSADKVRDSLGFAINFYVLSTICVKIIIACTVA
jgi:hypothetical protein